MGTGFLHRLVLGRSAWEREDIMGCPGLRVLRESWGSAAEARHTAAGLGCSGLASPSRQEMLEGGWVADTGY